MARSTELDGASNSGYVARVKLDDVRGFALRDRRSVTALKADFWADRHRRSGGLEAFRVGQALLAHARSVRPDWPTRRDREEDLAHHVELKRRLALTANVISGR